MDTRIYNLHIQTAKIIGSIHSCDGKVQHATEAIAIKVTQKMNARKTKKYDVEPYPCPFCNRWHVGRMMSIEEMEEIINRPENTKNMVD